VDLCYPFYDRKADAAPFGAGVKLVEEVEDLLSLVGLDTDTVVFDKEDGVY